MYEEFTWNNDKQEPMMIEIKHHGQVVFRFYMGEAMESAGRKCVMQHVRDCDHSPWLQNKLARITKEFNFGHGLL